MDEQTQGTTSQTPIAPKRLLRRLSLLTTILLIAGLSFAGGIAVQTAYPAMGQRWFLYLTPEGAGSRPSQLPVPGGVRPDREEQRADQLLGQVGTHARRLAEQKADLEREDKELNIAYHILRDRGRSDDSPECTRLVERHKQIKPVLKELEAALTEATRLEAKLHELVDVRGTPAGHVGLDAELRTEIRKCLARAAATNNPSFPIPDERWQGGPDKVMDFNASRDHGQDR